MLKQPPKPTDKQLAKIEQLEKHRADSLRLKEESWERSDTDGFLSQWAHGIGADLDRKQIELLKNGGHAPFPVLVDSDGAVVADRIFRFANKFAPWKTDERWRLPNDLADKLGRKWIPVAGYSGKSRVQKELGLREEKRWFPAYAKITAPAGATGLSGAASAYVGVFREDTNEER